MASAASLVCVLGLGLAACSSSAAPEDQRAAPALPLTASVQSPSGATYVIVPAGDLSSSANTFWQVIALSPGASHFALVTPRGVADNGGLAAAAAGPRLLVGFLTSRLLGFSPVVESHNAGRGYANGTLPGPLARVPAAVATGGGATRLALLDRDSGTVVSSSGSLSSWRALGRPSESSAGGSCGIRSLTAVAVQVSTGDAVVGAACSQPGEVGLYSERAGGSWAAIRAGLPGSLSHDTTTVAAVTSPRFGVFDVLLVVNGRSGSGLVGIQIENGTTHASAVEPLHAGEHLQCLASTASGARLALIAQGTSAAPTAERIVRLDGLHWGSLGTSPDGVQAVAVGSDGSVVLVSAHLNELTVLRQIGNSWEEIQKIRVPIQFGSSS